MPNLDHKLWEQLKRLPPDRIIPACLELDIPIEEVEIKTEIDKSMKMQNVIVAGIIDTQTGEIFDTTTKQSEKTKLYLKVRDEYNPAYGKDTFTVFSFDSIGGNLNYVKSKMKPNATLDEIMLLKAHYDIYKKEVGLEQLKSRLSEIEETQCECLAIYGKDQYTKRMIISDLLNEEIDDIKVDICTLSNKLNHMKYQLKRMETS